MQGGPSLALHADRPPRGTASAVLRKSPMMVNAMSYLRMVEAGGVEPPSEKPCHPKTTCLARSGSSLPVKAGCSFASCAQSGQETLPASPIISPPHYGPKRDSQPAV